MPIDHLPSVSLPLRRRIGESFRDLFGAPAADVLAAMDRAGDDVPNERPAHAVDISSVGMRRRSVPITIRDPFGSDGDVTAACTVCVTAGVPGSRRGVHVSRMGHLLADHSTGTYRDLTDYAEIVAGAVAASQYGRARVTVLGRIPYLERVHADPSGRSKLSLEHLDVIARQTVRDGRVCRDVGLRVTHLIACPCVQKTFLHATLLRDGDAHDRVPDTSATLMTHSQRCTTTVLALGVMERASVVDMLTRLDSVLFRTCNTLPRDAELSCVYRAHRAPQFIEDALRAAVLAMAGAWASPTSFRALSGRSRSLESIHEYDLAATLHLSASDLPPRR